MHFHHLKLDVDSSGLPLTSSIATCSAFSLVRPSTHLAVNSFWCTWAIVSTYIGASISAVILEHSENVVITAITLKLLTCVASAAQLAVLNFSFAAFIASCSLSGCLCDWCLSRWSLRDWCLGCWSLRDWCLGRWSLCDRCLSRWSLCGCFATDTCSSIPCAVTSAMK